MDELLASILVGNDVKVGEALGIELAGKAAELPWSFASFPPLASPIPASSACQQFRVVASASGWVWERNGNATLCQLAPCAESVDGADRVLTFSVSDALSWTWSLRVTDRANVFVIHSWDDAEDCRRLEELLRASDPALAHYTLPPERAVPGAPDEIAASIESRIDFATAVVVLNSPGLHLRHTSDFEMRRSVERGKRIVVVQPHGNFHQPVPAVLDGHVYRYATWRGDVVGRAIRGEYPYDGRVFDLAEVADRRRIVGVLAAGIAAASLLVVVDTLGSLSSLKCDLAAAGVEMRWTGEDTDRVVRYAVSGAVIGGALGLLTDDAKTALLMAAAGGAIGAAVGVRRTYQAHLLGTSHLKLLVVEPV